MRREEFDIKDENSINEVLKVCEYGTLSLINDLKPYLVALNFVQYKNAIYFHGAKEGKKIEVIKSNSNAAFLVVKPYSYIPSYFSDTMAACPATQFFASVLFEGKLSFIEDGNKKADILNALMKKFQNEDSFERIAYNKAMYTKMLDKTAIIELKIETQSCKIKVGQNLNEERKNKFLEKLKNRNSQIDNETIKAIEFYKKVIKP
ncbi:Pyridoxamine 5'-phosphate oxidase [Aliarcobacter thereius]|uniref:Antibiotic resistance protein n=1 Tax=Aliarcobacter thereius TaxID=544718 RepID=A0A5R9GZT0_9BACT|nr:pyridoxamine 5'-phosphate oxidase family protein [Aliarcobacter thereius]OCL86455.1 Pyridoxamine 5'-phosphate oxidase [Aliarcobacter thereius]TLS71343.1 antibiotic resistance protein [Aliarcobacter thereius]